MMFMFNVYKKEIFNLPIEKISKINIIAKYDFLPSN